MAAYYIDSRVSAAGNGSVGTPWRSITDYIRAGLTLTSADSLNFVAGSGPYTEVFDQNDGRTTTNSQWMNNDVTINAATGTLTSAGSLFPAGGLAANGYLILQGTQFNDGIWQISGTAPTASTIILATKMYANETLVARCRLARFLDAGTAKANTFPIRGTSAGVLGTNLQINGNGVTIDPTVLLTSSMYKWVASSAGADVYYLQKNIIGGSLADNNPNFCLAGDLGLIRQSVGVFYGYAVVNGLRYDISACSNNYPQATMYNFPGQVAALPNTLINQQWCVGNHAGEVGYNTIYMKWVGANPITQSIRLPMAWHNIPLDTTNIFVQYNNFRLRGGGLNAFQSVIPTGGGSNQTNTLNNCIIEWSGNSGALMGNTGELIATNCIAYWAGHRAFEAQTAGCKVSLNHCVMYGSHIALIANPTTTVTATNCIGDSVEGGVDISSTVTAFTETYNHWTSNFVSGTLNYNGTKTGWATTAATDVPPSAATTINTRSSTRSPVFVRTSDFGYDLCDFHLGAGSTNIGTGVPVAGQTTDLAGSAWNVATPNRGVYATVGINGSGNFGGSSSSGIIGSMIKSIL
jgi:hypothetical protein